MSKKTQCQTCKSLFYSKGLYFVLCGICDQVTCPECNTCDCSSPVLASDIHTITVDKLASLGENDLIELNGTLSPLISQKPIIIDRGPKKEKLLRTKFEFQDETGKIPLIIWGPVPGHLFSSRYEYVQNITILGAKKRNFKGKPQVRIGKKTKILFNSSIRPRNLDYFLNEAYQVKT